MLSAPIVCSTDFFLIHTTAAFLITVILSICHIFVSDKYTIPHNLELITCRVSIYRNMRLMQEKTRKSISQIFHLKLNYFLFLFLMETGRVSQFPAGLYSVREDIHRKL